MKSLIYLVSDRFDIVRQGLFYLFDNTSVIFDDILFINNGADIETTNYIHGAFTENRTHPFSKVSSINFSLSESLQNIMSVAIDYASFRNPSVCCIAKSSFVFRKLWLEEALEVIKANRNLDGVSNCSHHSTIGWNPGKLNSTFGNILTQNVKSPRGGAILNWGVAHALPTLAAELSEESESDVGNWADIMDYSLSASLNEPINERFVGDSVYNYPRKNS